MSTAKQYVPSWTNAPTFCGILPIDICNGYRAGIQKFADKNFE